MTITLEDSNGRVLAEITPGTGQTIRVRYDEPSSVPAWLRQHIDGAREFSAEHEQKLSREKLGRL